MRLSAKFFGLLQPFQAVLRPSLGEHAEGYAAHRQFLDGQLLVAMACLTALPIIETESQNVSAYIPTNLISITDGQVYLSPILFRKGILPAVDVGRSVSRVGGKTQLAQYRKVAGDLRLTYSQFEELERFARFSSQLDDETQETLRRGRLIREALKQPQFAPMEVEQQIEELKAATEA